MKLKYVLITGLIIITVITFFLVMMQSTKNSSSVSIARNSKFTGTDLTSCSATICGAPGTKYVSPSCSGPTGPVDFGLCSSNATGYKPTVCTSNIPCILENNTGLQNYHFSLKTVADKYSILGGVFIGAEDKQVFRFASPGWGITLPYGKSTANGAQTLNLNKLILPKGLIGNYVIMLFYYLTTSSTPLNITATVDTQTSIQIMSNYFSGSSAMHNTDISSSKLFYYILPINITNNTVASNIKFDVDASAVFNLDQTKIPDIFVLQVNSLPSICGNITNAVIEDIGRACRIGDSPLMARYKFNGATSDNPLGNISDIYTSGTKQVSDNIGLTFTQTGSVVTVNIPAVSKYALVEITTIKYIFLINWFGETESVEGLNLSIVKNNNITDAGVFSYGQTETTTTISQISNIGDIGKKLFLARCFSLNKTKSGSFAISVPSSGKFPGGNVSGDLVVMMVVAQIK